MSSQPQDNALYRRFEIVAKPGAQFVMLSSAAGADALDKLIGKAYIATTWQDYPGAWRHAELTELIGRAGLLIPDATPDAQQDMRNMASRLLEIGCPLRWTDTSGMPPDWSPVDWEGTPDEFVAWAKARTTDYVSPPVEPVVDTPHESVEPPPAEFPPEATLTEKPIPIKRPPRTRPQLATVDGNNALQPDLAAAPQPLSHDALAEHFVETYGNDWRYVAQWARWFEWDGDGWREDKMERPVGLAKQVTREAILWPDAATLTPSGRRDINSIGTAKSLLTFARSHQKVAATAEQWDIDPLYLGVPGGVIDLRDGHMLEPTREHYITKRCAVAPESGKPELWIKYLERAHGGNQDVIGYLQRYSGYCATGETKEHALAFLYGTGRNGKGVFLETISRILGDYARTASMDTFMEQAHSAHSTELARLHGARLVITEEAASGGKWNEARIKHLTGGGKITAHYMRQDDFEFTPSFKLLIAANHKPMLRSVDEAIKSRMHLVPFNVTIPPEDRDKDLLRKLEAEWPRILGWMLDGCAEWQRNGLSVPKYILDATEQYVESEDVFGQWLEECCERSGRVDGAAGYRNYATWCERQGEHVQKRRAWSNTMVERGFAPCKGTAGARMFDGVSLKFGEPSTSPDDYRGR